MSIADAYLAHHFAFRPVDASFMGIAGHDALLPDVSAGAADAERRGIAAMMPLLDGTEPGAIGERLDRRIARSQLLVSAAALDAAPRFANPAFYTGEALFGIISLLLPSGRPTPRDAVRARLLAIPDFLSDGAQRLASAAAPAAITTRARREATAAAAFLTDDLRLHPDWDARWDAPAAAAASAFSAFGAAIATLPDRPAACGAAYLELLMREAHGLDMTAEAAVAMAQSAFDRLTETLVEMAAKRDRDQSWVQQTDALNSIFAATPEATINRVRAIDAQVLADAGPRITAASDYGLDYRWLSPCFRNIAQASYFLPYRSPPADAPDSGSTYWFAPPSDDTAAWLRGNNDTALKVIHAVHHGSIGHHTQNARARSAASRLARIAGTDCALGLAFLSSGSMVEGWACYAQDLAGEDTGLYSDAETLYGVQQQRRNIASVLVDIRLHTGEWSPAEAGAFYRDQANFAPQRIEGEITRNIMLPATRLMYWLGTEQIESLRKRWTGSTRNFHDTLIGHGHIPVAWAGEEMARAGLLR